MHLAQHKDTDVHPGFPFVRPEAPFPLLELTVPDKQGVKDTVKVEPAEARREPVEIDEALELTKSRFLGVAKSVALELKELLPDTLRREFRRFGSLEGAQFRFPPESYLIRLSCQIDRRIQVARAKHENHGNLDLARSYSAELEHMAMLYQKLAIEGIVPFYSIAASTEAGVQRARDSGRTHSRYNRRYLRRMYHTESGFSRFLREVEQEIDRGESKDSSPLATAKFKQ